MAQVVKEVFRRTERYFITDYLAGAMPHLDRASDYSVSAAAGAHFSSLSGQSARKPQNHLKNHA